MAVRNVGSAGEGILRAKRFFARFFKLGLENNALTY